ncbi:hypothetical protein EV426DRAFT_602433, partial [Tirmania nivea]
VQMLLEGHAQKTLSRRGLTLLPLHHLMTVLSGCVLAHSGLDEKLSKVAGLAQEGGATTRSAGLGARVQWALWGERRPGQFSWNYNDDFDNFSMQFYEGGFTATCQ